MTPRRPSLVVASAAAGLLSLAVADAQVARPVPLPVRPPVGGFDPGVPQHPNGDFNRPVLPAPLPSGLGAPTGTPSASSDGAPATGGETAAEQPVDETAAEAVIDDYLTRHDLVASLPAVEKARAVRRGGD